MRRAAVLLVLVLAAAGCGKTGVTKKSYARSGNALCARYTRKISALSIQGSPSVKASATLIHRTAALVRKENGALRRIDSPPGLQKDVKAMLAARERLLDLFDRNAETIAKVTIAASRGDRRAAAQARQLQTLLAGPAMRAARLSTKLGLTTCAREFTGAG